MVGLSNSGCIRLGGNIVGNSDLAPICDIPSTSALPAVTIAAPCVADTARRVGRVGLWLIQSGE